jgi:arylsulfatase A-like enzyme
MSFKKYIFSSSILAFGLSQASFSVEPNTKPNIIILLADDLGWNDISSSLATMGHGSKFHQTPNIDRLANEGISFVHAYSQQNCAPSRAALLTGQYAPLNGVYNVSSLERYGSQNNKRTSKIIPPKQQDNVAASKITFAEVLRDAGYRTYMFGKTHGYGGDLDKDHGFDVDLACGKKIREIKESNYKAIQDADGNWIYENPLYNRFALPYTYAYIDKALKPFANRNNPDILEGSPKHFTDALTDVVVNEISNAPENTPFCMWVSFHAIHSGIVGREDLIAKYKALEKIDPRHTDVEYAALTEQMDQSVARIVDQLKKQGLLDNTLVIFSSDNGGVEGRHSNEPLRAGKGTFYEGGVRVPLIVRYPPVIQAGRVTNEVVHFVDFYPTLVDFAGAQTPDPFLHPLCGESFFTILKSDKFRLKRESIYWHFPGYMDERQEPNTVIVKRFDNEYFKFRYSYELNSFELYNTSTDLEEKNNLLIGETDKNILKIAEMMRSDLNVWLLKMNPQTMRYRVSGEVVGNIPFINDKSQ